MPDDILTEEQAIAVAVAPSGYSLRVMDDAYILLSSLPDTNTNTKLCDNLYQNMERRIKRIEIELNQ